MRACSRDATSSRHNARHHFGVKKRDVILEVQSMLGIGYQVAKSIVRLSEKTGEVFQQIGKKNDGHSGPGRRRRSMSNAEAKRIVDAAVERIALVDADD